MILPLDTDVIADLDRVGVIIDRSGIDAVPGHLLDDLATDAKALGIRTVATEVLLEGNDPAVARERAFAVLARHLVRARSGRTAERSLSGALG